MKRPDMAPVTSFATSGLAVVTRQQYRVTWFGASPSSSYPRDWKSGERTEIERLLGCGEPWVQPEKNEAEGDLSWWATDVALPPPLCSSTRARTQAVEPWSLCPLPS